MTAPLTSIVPVTMRKTDGAAPRNPVCPGASISRANHDRSTVSAVPSLISTCTDPDRIGCAALIHSSPMLIRCAHATVAALLITLSP